MADFILHTLPGSPYARSVMAALEEKGAEWRIMALATQFDFTARTPEWAVLVSGRANLVDWLARMNARPSMRATTWEKVAAMAA